MCICIYETLFNCILSYVFNAELVQSHVLPHNYIPFVGAEDARGEGGHEVISQAQNHHSAGQSSQHRRVQIVDEPARAERTCSLSWTEPKGFED